jgi:hypothetical protein
VFLSFFLSVGPAGEGKLYKDVVQMLAVGDYDGATHAMQKVRMRKTDFGAPFYT